jgi:hypothetical protein
VELSELKPYSNTGEKVVLMRGKSSARVAEEAANNRNRLSRVISSWPPSMWARHFCARIAPSRKEIGPRLRHRLTAEKLLYMSALGH